MGSNPLPNVMGLHEEQNTDSNGRQLIDFSSFNDLRITDTFLDLNTHKRAHLRGVVVGQVNYRL